MTNPSSKQVEVELKVCEWCKMPPETWAEPGEPHTAAVRCVNTECPVRSAGWVSPGFWNTRLPVASTADANEIVKQIRDKLVNGNPRLILHEIAELVISNAQQGESRCEHGIPWSMECLSCGHSDYVAATPASTAPGVGDGVRKLTLPEINHLLALLEAERESGEYAGPREQYYARTERLIKWCSDQIGEK